MNTKWGSNTCGKSEMYGRKKEGKVTRDTVIFNPLRLFEPQNP